MAYRPGYTETEVRDAVEKARSAAAALRRLGLRPAGGNYGTLKRLVAFYGISTDHFDPYWALNGPQMHVRIPLDEILVEGSTYGRSKLNNTFWERKLATTATTRNWNTVVALAELTA